MAAAEARKAKGGKADHSRPSRGAATHAERRRRRRTKGAHSASAVIFSIVFSSSHFCSSTISPQQWHNICTDGLQEFRKNVTRMLQECYKNDIWMLRAVLNICQELVGYGGRGVVGILCRVYLRNTLRRLAPELLTTDTTCLISFDECSGLFVLCLFFPEFSVH